MKGDSRIGRAAKPYSEDLRRRMVRAVEAGRSCHEVARLFGVSPSCVIKLMQCCRATGEVRPAKFGGWPRTRTRCAHSSRRAPT